MAKHTIEFDDDKVLEEFPPQVAEALVRLAAQQREHAETRVDPGAHRTMDLEKREVVGHSAEEQRQLAKAQRLGVDSGGINFDAPLQQKS